MITTPDFRAQALALLVVLGIIKSYGEALHLAGTLGIQPEALAAQVQLFQIPSQNDPGGQR